MIRRFPFLAGAALIAASPLAAQTATFDPQRLSQHVQTLGSDAFEGRGPATAGETKTVAYLSEQFAKAGLQPGGDLVERQAQRGPRRCRCSGPNSRPRRTSASISPARRRR